MAVADKVTTSLVKALRHGWVLTDMTRDAIWLERTDGKCHGSIYITPEGHVGYCPF